MIVNVISDIHADFDEKNGTVVYNAPFDFAISTICEASTALKKQFEDSIDAYKKLKFDNSVLNRMFDLPYIENVEQLADWIAALDRQINLACIGLNKDNVFIWSRLLTVVENFFRLNHIEWSYKKVEVDDIRKFLFKQIFDFDPRKLEPADYLIIAGDIGYANTYDRILADIKQRTEGKFKKILHIAGNHDHWYFRINKSLPEQTCPDYSHEYCEHVDGDYAFIGCTMWTPLGNDWMQYNCGRCMNDYRYIPGFSTKTGMDQFQIQSIWLKSKIAAYAKKKIVVFTHHQPFKELVEDDNKHNGYEDGRDVRGAYAVLDGTFDDINKDRNIMLWACGHTHMNFDATVHDVHVVRNPIGYRDHYGWAYSPPENCHSGSWYNKLIEV
jgi:predicted phosphohydrolase